MLSAETIRQMKQTNISVDAELTKERVHASWKSATKVQREIILGYTGLKQTAVTRAYATGNISAKIALAMAQALNIDPFYLTGEAGEPGEYSVAALNAFLTDKQYAHLTLEEQEKEKLTRKRRQSSSKEPTKDVEAAGASEVIGEAGAVAAEEQEEQSAPADIEPQEAVIGKSLEMPEDDAAFLLKTLFLRAKYSQEAQDKLNKVKALLIL